MKKAVVIGVVVVTALCVVAVWSQAPTVPGGAAGGGFMMSCPASALATPRAAMLERSAATLQLTDEQKGRLTPALTKSEATMRPLMQKAGEAALALRNAVLAPVFDAEKVTALATTAQTAEAAIVKARIETWTQIRAILTADQVAKLKETMTMRRGAGGRGTGPGRAPGGSSSEGGSSGESVPPVTPD